MRTSLLINPEELSKSWIDKFCKLNYTVLGIHPKAGKKSCYYMKELINMQDDIEYRTKIDYALEKGLEIEYECHAMGYLLPRELFIAHPEYFREDSNGIRTNDYNLCVSNKEALDIVCENALSLAKKLYGSNHNYYFWCDDVKEESTCMCSKCRNYSESDKNLIVINEIAKKLKSEIKDAKVAYLAYQKTLYVPEKIKPEDNVILEYAPIERKMDIPYIEQGEDNIKNIKSLLEYFGKKDSKVLEYWTDNSLFSSWTKPEKEYKPNYYVIEKDISLYSKLGFEYISAFACYLGEDYIKMYGEADIPSFSDIYEKGEGNE